MIYVKADCSPNVTKEVQELLGELIYVDNSVSFEKF
jgi:hypothetical protein